MNQLKENFTYSVFISYVREDLKFANWIQRAFEDFRTPFSLRKEMPELPGRIGPVFRDVVDLLGGVDFASQISGALISSKFMVVLCSPKAKVSQWVNREIECFISSRGERFVIPLVVSGRGAIEECIPDRLRNVHCIDARKKEDKKRAVWQVIARIVGVKPDMLLKRACFERRFLVRMVEKLRFLLRSISGDSESIMLDDYEPRADETDIFISYRRDGGREVARTIQLGLQGKGFKHVFFDYESMQDGRFNVQILDAIYSCKDFILVLTSNAMNRCRKKNDWVAREIRTALKYKCHIIPLVINESFQDWPFRFPKDLNSLRDLQRHQFRTDKFFTQSMEDLTKCLYAKQGGNANIQFPVVGKAAENDDYANCKIKVDIPCRVFIDGEEMAVAPPNKLQKCLLKRGEYLLEVVAIANETVRIEKIVLLDRDKVISLYLEGDRLVERLTTEGSNKAE